MSRSFDYKLVADMSASNASIGTMNVTNGTISNLVSTTASAGTAVATAFTGGSVSVSGSIASSSVSATSGTVGSFAATTSSAGTAVATAFTGGSLSVSGAVAATSGTVGSFAATTSSAGTAVATAFTGGALSVSGAASASSIAAASGTVGSFAATTSSAGTAVATAFTGGSLSVSGSISSNSIAAASGTVGSFVATTSSAGTAVATTFTGGSLSLSGDIKIGGTLTTVNITTTNLVDTNISAGTLSASTISASTSSAGTAVATTFTGGSISVDSNIISRYNNINTLAAANQALLITNPSSTSGSFIEFNRASNNARALIGIDGHNYANLDTGALVLGPWSNHSIKFLTNATERMCINTAGNVGIGVNTPTSKLHVIGNIAVNDWGNLIGFVPNDTFIFQNKTMGNYTLSWDVTTNPNGAAAHLSGWGGINFFTQTTNRMMIDATGNVGIGTTTPSYKLHVNGVIQGINVRVGNSSFTTNSNDLYVNTGTTNQWIYLRPNGDSSSTGESYFNVNETSLQSNAVFINSSKNVGIGSTSPSTRLEVVGPAFFNNDTVHIRKSLGYDQAGSVTSLMFGGYDNDKNLSQISAYGFRYFSTGLANTLGRISLFNFAATGSYSANGASTTGNYSDVMTVVGSDIGINTTSPSAKLHVQGGGTLMVNGGEAVLRAAGGTVSISPINDYTPGVDPGDTNRCFAVTALGATKPAILSIRPVNAANFFDLVSDSKTNNFYLHSYATGQIMTFTSNGNLGIGTSSPSNKLHVNGGATIEGTIIGNSSIELRGDSVSYIDFGPASIDFRSRIIHYETTRSLQFEVNSNNVAMTLASTGNVGIGTADPSYKLDVRGVTQSTWGFLSYRTFHFYEAGNNTWNAGDPTNWPWVGNTFIITFTGNPIFGSTMIFGMYRIYHSRWSAGNNNAVTGEAIGSTRGITSFALTDGSMSFTFGGPNAQSVQITIVSYN